MTGSGVSGLYAIAGSYGITSCVTFFLPMGVQFYFLLFLFNLAPEYLCAKLKKRSSIHNRTTRNNDKFEIPSFRSASGQRTFAYRAVSLWNMLDEDLRNATTVKAFKKAMKLVMNE